jgi:proteasome accessory factor B
MLKKMKETAPGSNRNNHGSKKNDHEPAKIKTSVAKKSAGQKPPPIPRQRAGEANRRTHARYYRMLEMVQRGDFPNATNFKRELGMSARSVTRDFEYLKLDFKVPVEFCRKRNGWYFTEPVTHFPALLISAREILSMLLARRAMDHTRNAAFAKDLENAMDKFGVVMTDEISALWTKLDSLISFRSSAIEVLVDANVCMKVCDALLDEEEIELMYWKNRTPAPAPKRLRPIHLLCIDSAWYLFAHEPGKPDSVPHKYLLSRMSEVRRTGTKFKRPQDFDLDELLAHSIGVYSGDTPEHLHLRLRDGAIGWFRERRFHDTQQFIDLPDGTAELTMDVAINPELERLILSWGAQAEVLAPRSLRESIWKTAQEIFGRGPVST